MSDFKRAAFALLPVLMMALAACGGSNSATTTDPFATNTAAVAPGQREDGTIFGNISTVTGKTGISLSTDRPSVDVNNSQVLLSARVISSGAPVGGVPVTFSILAPVNGPASIETGMTTVRTDSNGLAITRATAGSTPYTSNVIVSASVKIGQQTAVANTSFQIVRGGGVIMFSPEAGITPGGQSNILTPISKEVESTVGAFWNLLQLVPFKVTDSNGNPRVGVPVTLSVYSITSLTPGDITINFLVPPVSEPDRQTITTDSAGQGIFNVAATLATPPPSGTNAFNVVYKAVTNDPVPVTAYVGGSYSITAKPLPK